MALEFDSKSLLKVVVFVLLSVAELVLALLLLGSLPSKFGSFLQLVFGLWQLGFVLGGLTVCPEPSACGHWPLAFGLPLLGCPIEPRGFRRRPFDFIIW